MRHRFSFITTVITLVALLLGNLVTATNSGDACGANWPKCNGSLFPNLSNYKTIIEYSHRIFTGILGIIILVNLFIAFKKKVKGEKLVTILACIGMFILILQSLVGGLNVLLGTPPGFTTIDVTVSLSLLVSLVLLTTALQRKPVSTLSNENKLQQKNEKKLFYPILISFSLYYLEIIIGAFFKHSAASKVFLDIPAEEQLIYSQFLANLLYDSHGILNFVILVSSVWLLFYSFRFRIMRTVSSLFLLFVLLTGLTGFISVFTSLGTISSSMHMIVSSITIAIGAIILGKTAFGSYVLIKR
ncbi:COX15/CtaA family protein [Aquibacillus sp. 3ASR75-11]|uniref:COX15/CtaA family protein n=1 Tax=Terrihalobacillus insolitus TaxID=2950438 RepID=A0A9X3WTW8_9BACI|nr:COX15/CtaA family protein [Terrihalobacillus insolitus]MDC3425862.1 COX15/CtaA family protein [Terrihalobacillus insolitus]